MANATPRTYIYGLIVFTLIIVGGISMYASFAAYSPAMTSNTKYGTFNSTFNRYNDLNSSVAGLSDSVTNAQSEIGVFGVLNGLINTAWNGLKFIFTSFGFVGDIGAGLTNVFGVPAWIPSLLILGITVMLVFTIWSAIFQSEL
jgi:hypothetical protein